MKRNMPTSLLLSLGAGLAFALTACSATPATSNTGSVEIAVSDRHAAPKITGELLDGSAYDGSAGTGKVVVINFWASWCAPCRAEATDLEKVYAATKTKGVVFLGVNVNDEKDKALAFAQNARFTYPSLYDRPGRVALGFEDVPPTAIPSTLVIDRQGRVAAAFIRAITADELQPVVERISAESPGNG